MMLTVGTMPPRLVRAETRLIPTISLSERYDSNVFYSDLVDDPADYVTNLSPLMKVEHKGRFMEGALSGGATGEVYAKNPGLNYVGLNGGLTLNLDNMVKRLMPRAGLQLSDSFIYTPQPPAFYTPGLGENPGADAAERNAFTRGLQAYRINSLSNAGSAKGSYLLLPSTAFEATYTHSLMRFGSGLTDPTLGGAFSATNQMVTAGPSLQLSALDTFSLNYQYSKMTFDTGGQSLGLHTNGGTVGWKRVFTPSFTASATAGATVLEPGSQLQYLASASLLWKYEYTSGAIQYSRGVFPTFLATPAPLVSDVVTISASHVFNQRLSATGFANYGLNRDPTSTFFFESYGAGGNVTHNISRIWSLLATYNYFTFEGRFGGTGAGSLTTGFDRHVMNLTLRATWN